MDTSGKDSYILLLDLFCWLCGLYVCRPSYYGEKLKYNNVYSGLGGGEHTQEWLDREVEIRSHSSGVIDKPGTFGGISGRWLIE